MKATRIVILIETLLIILAAAVAPRIYKQTQDQIDGQSETIETLQKQVTDLGMQYEDVNEMYQELRRRDVAESIEQHAEDVNPDLPGDVNELKRMISVERKQHAELENAFERLKAELDGGAAVVGSVATASGKREGLTVDFDERAYTETINRRVSALQRRIEQTDDPKLQQNLVMVGDTLQNIRELAQKGARAKSNAARHEIRDQLVLEERRLNRITQETRRLEFGALADTFGIPENRKVEFSRRVNQIVSNTSAPLIQVTSSSGRSTR